jgi:hypothetical protein
MSAFGGADNANVQSLRYCVEQMGTCGESLTGDGSKVWGDPLDHERVEKTLSELILNFFTGLFKPPTMPPRQCQKEFQEELIVPNPGRTPDALTLWVVHSLVPLYQRLWEIYRIPLRDALWSWLRTSKKGKDEESRWGTTPTNGPTISSSSAADAPVRNLTEYSALWIIRVTSIVTTVVACLLPTIAIIILARVTTIGATLGLIALFTALFALGLILLSSGSSRMQIFTATAM